MELIGITITAITLLVLILAFVGMWKSNTDRLSDYNLYGMDGEDYFKKQLEIDLVKLVNDVYEEEGCPNNVNKVFALTCLQNLIDKQVKDAKTNIKNMR
jgi:hypothetical protein